MEEVVVPCHGGERVQHLVVIHRPVDSYRRLGIMYATCRAQ